MNNNQSRWHPRETDRKAFCEEQMNNLKRMSAEIVEILKEADASLRERLKNAFEIELEKLKEQHQNEKKLAIECVEADHICRDIRIKLRMPSPSRTSSAARKSRLLLNCGYDDVRPSTAPVSGSLRDHKYNETILKQSKSFTPEEFSQSRMKLQRSLLYARLEEKHDVEIKEITEAMSKTTERLNKIFRKETHLLKATVSKSETTIQHELNCANLCCGLPESDDRLTKDLIRRYEKAVSRSKVVLDDCLDKVQQAKKRILEMNNEINPLGVGNSTSTSTIEWTNYLRDKSGLTEISEMKSNKKKLKRIQKLSTSKAASISTLSPVGGTVGEADIQHNQSAFLTSIHSEVSQSSPTSPSIMNGTEKSSSHYDHNSTNSNGNGNSTVRPVSAPIAFGSRKSSLQLLSKLPRKSPKKSRRSAGGSLDGPGEKGGGGNGHKASLGYSSNNYTATPTSTTTSSPNPRNQSPSAICNSETDSENLCLYCCKYFSGQAYIMPSLQSIDRSIIIQKLGKSNSSLFSHDPTTTAASSSRATPTGRPLSPERTKSKRVQEAIRQRMKSTRVFCSWICMKKWSWTNSNLQLRYHNDMLIDLVANDINSEEEL